MALGYEATAVPPSNRMDDPGAHSQRPVPLPLTTLPSTARQMDLLLGNVRTKKWLSD